MRPKSGLPKRKPRRALPEFVHGFRTNPQTARYRHPGARATTTNEPRHTVVSLFCGCGGLDLGFMGGFRYLGRTFKAHPFEVIDAVDIDERAIETYRLNLGDHGRVGDLVELSPHGLLPASVLVGGFPCQDFSSSGPKVGFAGERGQLYRVMSAYMREHRPRVVVAENVPHLKRLHGGKYLDEILSDFEDCGYTFQVWNLYCPDYGLSQSRRRLFLVGVRDDIPGAISMPLPSVSAHVPIEVALDDLVAVADESVTNQSQYFVATKATAGGGQGDHTNKRGEVAYCIRANAKARIQFHYSLDRRLTVRECARLQSFPDQFVFPFAAMTNMLHIGNAVPPMIAHQVAASVADFLQNVDSASHATREPGTKRRRPHQRGLFDVEQVR